MNQSNIHIIEVPEEEEREQKIINSFEVRMAEKFPNLVRRKDT